MLLPAFVVFSTTTQVYVSHLQLLAALRAQNAAQRQEFHAKCPPCKYVGVCTPHLAHSHSSRRWGSGHPSKTFSSVNAYRQHLGSKKHRQCAAKAAARQARQAREARSRTTSEVSTASAAGEADTTGTDTVPATIAGSASPEDVAAPDAATPTTEDGDADGDAAMADNNGEDAKTERDEFVRVVPDGHTPCLFCANHYSSQKTCVRPCRVFSVCSCV